MTADDGAAPGDDGEVAEYGDFPLKRYLSMEVTGDEVGVGVAQLDVGPEHLNPNSVVHGAVVFALVDTAMGKATMSVLDDGFCASVELSIRFVRPAAAGGLVARAEVIKRGRHLVHLRADVIGSDERLIATSHGTFAILGT
ncbi:MAG: PaaI family thioesterase [Ilumatobacteraceae bacterium]